MFQSNLNAKIFFHGRSNCGRIKPIKTNNMAAKPINPEVTKKVIASWRTGEYSYSELAAKFKISKAKVGQLCKGIEQDLIPIVDAGTQYRSGLANQDRRIVDAVNEVVDEKTKHIQFFNDVTVQNISSMMSKVDESASIMEHRIAQAAIKDGKEVVLGKAPETAIQVNNNGSQSNPIAELIAETTGKVLRPA